MVDKAYRIVIDAASAAQGSSQLEQALRKIKEVAGQAGDATGKLDTMFANAARSWEKIGTQLDAGAKAWQRIQGVIDNAAQQVIAGAVSVEQAQERINAAIAKWDPASKQATRDFAEMQRAAAALAAQYDPLGAAQDRYAANVEIATRAQAAGIISAQQYQAILHGETAAVQAASIAAGAGGNVFGRYGLAIQNAGYQVGDFAVQLASGTNPIRAFTQQGTQLVSMFGPWGAVLGAAGAIVGALATNFLHLGDSTQAALERQKALNDELQKATDLMDKLNGKANESRDALLAERQSMVSFGEAKIMTLQGMIDDLIKNKQAYTVSGKGATKPTDEFVDLNKQLLEARRNLEQLKAALGYFGGGHGSALKPHDIDMSVQNLLNGNPALFGTPTPADWLAAAHAGTDLFGKSLPSDFDASVQKLLDANVNLFGPTVKLTTDQSAAEKNIDRMKSKLLELQNQYDDLTKNSAIDDKVAGNLQGFDLRSKAAQDLAGQITGLTEKINTATLANQAFDAQQQADAAAVQQWSAEMERGRQVMESLRTPQEQYLATLGDLGKLLKEGAIDQATYDRGWAQAKATFDAAAQSTKIWSNAMTELGSTFESAFNSAVVSGKSLHDVLQGLLQDLAQLALRATESQAIGAIFGSSGGSGGLLGSLWDWITGAGNTPGARLYDALIPAAVHHAGGRVGVDPVPMRPVPSSVFVDARRYHSGGMVLGPDEVPAILQRGERVLARGQQAGGDSMVINQSITINASGGTPAQNHDLASKVSAAVEQAAARAFDLRLRNATRVGGLLNPGRAAT